jgi:lysophospholipase L1-like esterase
MSDNSLTGTAVCVQPQEGTKRHKQFFGNARGKTMRHIVYFFVAFCAFSWPLIIGERGTVDAAEPAPPGNAVTARFEPEIAAFEKWDRQNAFPKNAVLFVGSSSIRLWQTAEAFPELPVINRGFGGSTIADVNHFFDRIVLKYRPAVIVFYSGDNDIANGKSPQQVYEAFLEFARLVREALPKTSILFISIKPSMARIKLWPKMEEANASVSRLAGINPQVVYVDVASPMLNRRKNPSRPGRQGVPSKELFLEDGLHLNAAGYELWNLTLKRPLKMALEQTKLNADALTPRR